MKNRFFCLTIFSLVLLMTSCKKKVENFKPLVTVCNVEKPLTELDWLKNIKDAFDLDLGPSINKITLYTYNQSDVFLIENCVQCFDNYYTVHNCEGVVICEFGTIAGLNTCPDFVSNAIPVEVLYEN